METLSFSTGNIPGNIGSHFLYKLLWTNAKETSFFLLWDAPGVAGVTQLLDTGGVPSLASTFESEFLNISSSFAWKFINIFNMGSQTAGRSSASVFIPCLSYFKLAAAFAVHLTKVGNRAHITMFDNKGNNLTFQSFQILLLKTCGQWLLNELPCAGIHPPRFFVEFQIRSTYLIRLWPAVQWRGCWF